MMTTQNSKTTVLLKKLAILPLLAGFIFLFAERIEAQEKDEVIETIYEQETSKQDIESQNKLYKDYYHRNARVKIFDKKIGIEITKKYSELTNKEKKQFNFFTPPLKTEKKVPSQKLIDNLKDGEKYAIWIDGKVMKNNVLDNYKNTDFSNSLVSFVHKNARSKRFPQNYQASLYTNEYFKNENKKKIEKFLEYLKKEYQIEEIIEEKPKKKYIDSPIPTNKSSKQSVDIMKSKLQDINNLKLTYSDKDTLPKKSSASRKQMKEYKAIVEKRKRTDIFKVKEVNKIKEIYSLMSDEQKKSVINVDNFIKTIPILPPKPDWVFTYKRLAYRVGKTANNRKANLIYLKEIYNNKMSPQERKKVTAPDKIVLSSPSSKMDTIPFTYNLLVKKIESNSKIKKVDADRLQFLYNKMNQEQKSKVESPDKILPPVPPMPKTLEINNSFKKQYQKNYNEDEPTFYLDGKKISKNDFLTISPKIIKSVSVNRNGKKKMIYIYSKQKKLPNTFMRTINDSLNVSFSSSEYLNKKENAVSKMSKEEKKSFDYRKTILYSAEMKGEKINYKIENKSVLINEVNNYIIDNPKSLIKTSDNSDGTLTLMFFDSKTEKMNSDQLQNIYTKVFQKTK